MYREVTLAVDVRCFERFEETSMLVFSGSYRRKGEVLTVGPAQLLIFDHKCQDVVPFTFGNKEYFILLSELNVG